MRALGTSTTSIHRGVLLISSLMARQAGMRYVDLLYYYCSLLCQLPATAATRPRSLCSITERHKIVSFRCFLRRKSFLLSFHVRLHAFFFCILDNKTRLMFPDAQTFVRFLFLFDFLGPIKAKFHNNSILKFKIEALVFIAF